jgi:hypothetical protein
MCYRSHVESESSQVDGGSALAFAFEIGNRHSLDSETLSYANRPLPPDGSTSDRILSEHLAGGNIGRVETIFKLETQTECAGRSAGFRDGHVSQLRDLHLAAMDRQPHRKEGGYKGDRDHCQGTQDDIEEAPYGSPAHEAHTESCHRELSVAGSG